MIKSLQKSFNLTDELYVDSFLGIKLGNLPDNHIKITQTGLI